MKTIIINIILSTIIILHFISCSKKNYIQPVPKNYQSQNLKFNNSISDKTLSFAYIPPSTVPENKSNYNDFETELIRSRKEKNEINKQVTLSTYEDYYLAGTQAQRIGNYHEAIQFFKKALHLNPINPNIYNRLGSLYEIIEDYKKALEMYEKAIELMKQP